jgi:predicted amidophosphoribosyltransferase
MNNTAKVRAQGCTLTCTRCGATYTQMPGLRCPRCGEPFAACVGCQSCGSAGEVVGGLMEGMSRWFLGRRKDTASE